MGSVLVAAIMAAMMTTALFIGGHHMMWGKRSDGHMQHAAADTTHAAQAHTCSMHGDTSAGKDHAHPGGGVRSAQRDSVRHGAAAPDHASVEMPGGMVHATQEVVVDSMRADPSRRRTATAVNACPMHPDVSMTTSGDCPRCAAKSASKDSTSHEPGARGPATHEHTNSSDNRD